ncbi:unnamed protein product [Penicillium nalgiovense]|uniref:HMG box domain-containing protein n=1 Tax=Penicillium nalgiovense TaxID=60175 RepID=A0A9W4I482_PENNA|nr:unnamed protein product [Penicillium nalgiovense]CAG8134346.1 unnamed protein product [Penicillium nalgiovense]CAG8189307.1 unnamed protein product [Penicillium nalgiovense]CAG8190813.1 unnamed protein product [Penicillium nalgiovense]CAG8197692.1 unnamed protein product [Penicillium nalgiovense]
MPWQSAARGGFLRTLHRGALSPRTGVSDLQDQLRRVSLTASSGLARPQFQLLSSTQSMFQSNSFATASTPLKATKTPKAKSSKKVGSEAKKKKPLSEKQQEIENIKKHRAHIRELQATALLSSRPKRFPTNAFAIAMSELLPQTKGYSSHREAFLAAVERAKSIGPQDEERYQAQAKANFAANTAAYDSWVKSHTPLRIKEANTARLTLSRLANKNYPPIKDDRLVRVSRSAYILFLKDRVESLDYQGKSGSESFPAIGREWIALPQAEKDRYRKLQIEDRQRYEREYQEVYGIPAPESSHYQSPEDYL